MADLLDTTTIGLDPQSVLLLKPPNPQPQPPHASNLFNKSCMEDSWYSLWRKDCGPTLYPSNKTPVTADVLEAGLLFAMGICAISLFAVALGVRGKRTRWFFPVRCVLALFILTSILLCNFGQEWEVSELYTKTPYRPGLNEEIHAHVGVKIGLRSVNITLRADPEVVSFKHGLQEERINYNERYHWDSLGFTQGRNGFGPYAGLYNREFRASQFRGTPLPILWVSEYFTLDGEGIRWGRHYREAGWYAHIMMWMAFPLWILTMVLFYMVISYGAICSLMTGLVLGSANLIFAFVRNPLEIDGVIPFEGGRMQFHYGWCFWMNLVTACMCAVIGVIFLALDFFNVEAVAAFLAKDIQQEFEDVYVEVATVGADAEVVSEDTVDVDMLRSLSCVSAMSSNSQLKQYLVCHYQRRRGTNGSLIGKLQKHGRRPTVLRSIWSREDALNSTPATPRPSFQLDAPMRKVKAKVAGSESPSKQVNWSDFTGVYDNVDLSAEFRERLMRQRSSAATLYEEQEMSTMRDVVVEVDASFDSSSEGDRNSLNSPGNSMPNSLPDTPVVETPRSPPPCTANILELPLFTNARRGSSSSLLPADQKLMGGSRRDMTDSGKSNRNYSHSSKDSLSEVVTSSTHSLNPSPGSSNSSSSSASHLQSSLSGSSHLQKSPSGATHSPISSPSPSHLPHVGSSHNPPIPIAPPTLSSTSSHGSSTMSCSPTAGNMEENSDFALYDNVFVQKL